MSDYVGHKDLVGFQCAEADGFGFAGFEDGEVGQGNVDLR